MKSKAAVDEIDLKILSALQKDGRCSFSDLARSVGLSPPAITERVRRLEADGVIKGYGAFVDPAALGYSITAVIRIAVPTGSDCITLLERLKQMPEVLEAFRVTGPDSAVVKAVVTSSAHLQELIDRMTTLGKPTTSIATSAFARGFDVCQISSVSR